MCDRWAIVEAWYYYCMNNHTGQNSRWYKRLSKIQTYFKPGAFVSGMTDEGGEVYKEIVKRHGGE